ncbi:glucosaminidase domain-containing protein [Sphingobacterium sp. Mn56C]|uniref:glucosaminidase domain-containing protein n=1 Tax=Sphingobacterium sp. Mn56C TaxID=3395261 RepID=UPI003BE07001
MRALVVFFMVIALLSSCSSKKRTVLANPKHSSSTWKKPDNRPAGGGRAGGTISGQHYIERYKDIAIREMNQYGIPASIKLAQALLESGNGNSYLAKEANNHFGIKCGGTWRGKSVSRADDSPNDCFRVYDNPEQSFKDHSQFLLRKRYEKLFSLAKNDYKGWARGLKDAGYATNPRYPELLVDLIERYQLYQYDRAESFVEREVREHKVETVIEQKIETEPPVAAEQIKSPVAMVIHQVKNNDTLFSLARQYNVTIDQIKQLNGMSNDNLALGQLLVISK